MPKLIKEDINEISYFKTQDGEITERFIIPTNIPTDYVDALDVSHLTSDEMENIKTSYKEYQSYVKTFKETMFNFADWAEHSGKDIDIKYRRFKQNQLSLIKNP